MRMRACGLVHAWHWRGFAVSERAFFPFFHAHSGRQGSWVGLAPVEGLTIFARIVRIEKTGTQGRPIGNPG